MSSTKKAAHKVAKKAAVKSEPSTPAPVEAATVPSPLKEEQEIVIADPVVETPAVADEPEVVADPMVSSAPTEDAPADTHVSSGACGYLIGVLSQFFTSPGNAPTASEVADIVSRIARREVMVLVATPKGPEVVASKGLKFFEEGVVADAQRQHGDDLLMVLNRQLVRAKLHWAK